MLSIQNTYKVKLINRNITVACSISEISSGESLLTIPLLSRKPITMVLIPLINIIVFQNKLEK